MTYKKIGDYGIIGNRRTVALISNDGSIDFMPLTNTETQKHGSQIYRIVQSNKGNIAYQLKFYPRPLYADSLFNVECLAKMISQSLKTKLLIMRGLYFDVEQGNVDYDALRASKEYQQYRDETKKLNAFNFDSLKTDEAKNFLD